MMNKFLSDENIIIDVDVFIHKLGLIKRQNQTRINQLFRYLIILTSILYGIRSIIALMIYRFKSDQLDKYERIFIWLGDYSYQIPKIRFHVHVIIIVFIMQTSSIQILHNKLLANRNYVSFKWLKPFEMLAGKLKPSQIGFTNCYDLNHFIKR